MGDNVVVNRINPSDTSAAGIGKPLPDIQVVSRSQNRNLNAANATYASATNSATWTSPGVNEVSITPIVTLTQGGLQNAQACLVVYDAPNDAVAAAWLADIGSVNADVEYDIVFVGQTLTRTFNSPTGPAPIKRVDVLPIGTGVTTMRVLIGAN